MNLRLIIHRFGLPAAGGLLLALAFPPFDAGQLAWIGLIPLLYALEDCRGGEAFRRGYVAGLVFFGMTVWWVVHVSLAAPVLLMAFLALYFGAAGWWFSRLHEFRGGSDSVARNFVAILLGAAGWVVLEWVRGKFLLGGFGWNTLGASQYRAVPLLQFTSATGLYGVSALLVVVNWSFYLTVRRFVGQLLTGIPIRRLSWEFYVAMILVAGAFLFGVRNIRRDPAARVVRLALVQANIPQSLKFDPAQKPLTIDRYQRLTRIAASGRPDLILWPETATPEALRFDAESFALATNEAGLAQVPLLTGTVDYDTSVNPPVGYNATALIRPDGTVAGMYRKMHLVPFGEYVPWRKLVPVVKWFTPIADSFERGTNYTVFAAAGFRFGAVICFEDTVPDLYRRFVREDVDFMVNLTNDAWFKESPAAALHLANAVLRAVETRRPLVRVTNNGMTCVIDEYGFIEHRLAPFVESSLVCEVRLPAERVQTFYTRHGDVFAASCGLVTGLGLVLLRRRQRVPLPAPKDTSDAS